MSLGMFVSALVNFDLLEGVSTKGNNVDEIAQYFSFYVIGCSTLYRALDSVVNDDL